MTKHIAYAKAPIFIHTIKIADITPHVIVHLSKNIELLNICYMTFGISHKKKQIFIQSWTCVLFILNETKKNRPFCKVVKQNLFRIVGATRSLRVVNVN